MKNLLFILLAFITFSACKNKAPQQTISSESVPGTGDLSKYVLTDIPGSTTKKALMKDQNGRLIEEGYVINGKKTGAWFTFYQDGRIMAVRNYVDDKVEGYYITLDQLGRVVLQVEYRDNYADGYSVLYKNGSRKIKETPYKHGKREGIEREYYELRGLQKESTYKADSLDGPMKFYNEDGKVIAEYQYSNGKKISGGAVK
jgi:antitoxin component YwqK of YwqJK toxin-antitoxin module